MKCPKCGADVKDERENWNWLNALPHELLCPKCIEEGGLRALTLVAINGVHISKILKPSRSMLKRSVQLSSGVYVLNVRTFRDKCALRALNFEAVSEEMSFHRLPAKEMRVYLLLARAKLLGYLSWNALNTHNLPTIRQLYVVKDERRKGYATALVQHFVEANCKVEANRIFLVEYPNELTTRLLVKLGYVKEINGELVGQRIGFIYGG